MMDAKHTPEPWYCEPHRPGSGPGTVHDWTVLGNNRIVEDDDPEFSGACATVVAKVLGNITAGGIPEANAARIVACVNAMAGIVDPEAFVAECRPLTDAEAERALDEVQGVPLSEERIAEMVQYATGTDEQREAISSSNLLRANADYRKELAALRDLCQRQTEAMAELREELAGVRAERDRYREAIRYWSYCTYSGMRRECPEKEFELREVYSGFDIQPYASLTPVADGEGEEK